MAWKFWRAHIPYSATYIPATLKNREKLFPPENHSNGKKQSLLSWFWQLKFSIKHVLGKVRYVLSLQIAQTGSSLSGQGRMHPSQAPSCKRTQPKIQSCVYIWANFAFLIALSMNVYPLRFDSCVAEGSTRY